MGVASLQSDARGGVHMGMFQLSVVWFQLSVRGRAHGDGSPKCIWGHLSVRGRAHRGFHLNVKSFNFTAVLVATDHDLRFILIETDRQPGMQASRVQRFAMTSPISGSASPATGHD